MEMDHRKKHHPRIAHPPQTMNLTVLLSDGIFHAQHVGQLVALF